ncbi:hypothetical protein QQ045_021189 [Rhodiola kirilowii]
MAQVGLLCCWVFMSLAAAGLSSSAHGEAASDAAFYSKLQEKKYHKFPVIKGSNADDAMDLNDYGPYDPSPNSRSRIHSGPIYHNTPLNPRIPKSPPHLKGRKKRTAPSPLV